MSSEWKSKQSTGFTAGKMTTLPRDSEDARPPSRKRFSSSRDPSRDNDDRGASPSLRQSRRPGTEITRNQSDDDASPPRRPRNNTFRTLAIGSNNDDGDDASPSHRGSRPIHAGDSDGDASPPRLRRPNRTARPVHSSGSDGDASPPRRRPRDRKTSSDAAKQSNEIVAPPRGGGPVSEVSGRLVSEPDRNRSEPGKSATSLHQKKRFKPSTWNGTAAETTFHNAPPNRFGIRPGPRWDGIDRSNGFEIRLQSMRASRHKANEDRYRASVIDL